MLARLSVGMQRLGLTVAALVYAVNKAREAKGAGPIGDAGIRYWLRGQREPSMADLKSIAAALECDPGWLAFGKDSAAPPPKWLQPPTTPKQPLAAHAEGASVAVRRRRKGTAGQEGTG